MTVEAEERVRAIGAPRDDVARPPRNHGGPDRGPEDPVDAIDALAQRPAVRSTLAFASRLERNWPLSVAVILGAVAALSFL